MSAEATARPGSSSAARAVTRYHLHEHNAPAPGVIRHMADPDRVLLHESIKNREDWPLLLCAFANAIARGVSIEWKQ